ncbi:hypothetical protein MANES_18G036500v8 [Manihot esculenta]|uniref:EF-hand domain-containing protein n=1 Tax=Manihot esculenta TaxID=3983 RepID=A0A2C9U0B1_MANES|nr:hypothetical protein MANES_18G036500v8 [Manihot esculenta]
MASKLIPRSSPVVIYTEAQAKGMLLKADRNRDGVLNFQELTEGFKSVGSKAPSVRALEALYLADENRDGRIDQKELDMVAKLVGSLGYPIK